MKIFLLFLFAVARVSALDDVVVDQTDTVVPSQQILSSSPVVPPSVSSSQKVNPTGSASVSVQPSVSSSQKIEPTSSASASVKPSQGISSSQKAGPTSITAVHHSTAIVSNSSSSTVVPSKSAIAPSSATLHPPMKNSTAIVSNSSSSTVVPSKSAIVPSNATSHTPMTTSIIPTMPPATTTVSPDVAFNYAENNKTCLQLKGDINIVVAYSDEHKKIVTQAFHLDHTTKVTGGKCSDLADANSTSYIKLNMKSVLDVTIHFTGGAQWYLSELNVSVYNLDEKNLNTTLTELLASQKYELDSNGGFYRAKSNYSYYCSTLKKLQLVNNNSTIKSYNITVDFKDIHIQPFDAPGHFNHSVTCPASTDNPKGSSIVPIAVGCALAGLIVIVLIAYLIGRRKGNNRGYQQV